MAGRRGGAAVAFAALAMVAVGCGGDDGEPVASGAPASNAPPATQPATTAPAAVAPTAPDATAPDTTESAPPTTPPATASDVCALLASVDVDGLLGEAAGQPEATADDFGGACEVTALDPASRGTVTLRVTTNSAAANYENARTQFGVDAELSGLGEGAFTSGAMVVVLAGDQLLTLQAVRWRDLGIDGVSDTELEVAASEVLRAAGPGDGAAPLDGSVCDLLAGIDFGAIVGEPVESPQVDEGDADTCAVVPSDPDSTAAITLTVFASDARRRFDETKEIFGVDTEATGLGDEAFHSGPALAVLDGDRGYVLWVLGDIMLGANVDDAVLETVMAQVLDAAG